MEILVIEIGLILALCIAAYCLWRILYVRQAVNWLDTDVRNHEVRLRKLEGIHDSPTNRNVKMALSAANRIHGGQQVEPPEGIIKPSPPPAPPRY